MLPTLKGLAPCLVALLAAPARADPPTTRPTPAAWADDFVASVGVNTHWRSPADPYDRHYDALKARLAQSGIRHLRDGAMPDAFRRAADLHAALGIRTTFIVGPRTGENAPGHPEYRSPLVPAKVAGLLADLRAHVPTEAIAAIEGPNEYDVSHDDRDPDWPATLRALQTELYRAVKSDPALKDIPVIGPSLTTHGACQSVGDLSDAMDFGCGHFYRSTRFPGSGGWGGAFQFPPYGGGNYGSMEYNLAAARVVCARKPIWSTETGYSTQAGGVPESIQAKYIPRLAAEFFRLGLPRTHLYELLDEGADPKNSEDHFGLLRPDATEKPAMTALSSLLNFLADNHWDAAEKHWTAPPLPPGDLAFTLAGDTRDVRTLLLRKRDGDFHLLLWQEVADASLVTEPWQPKYQRDAQITLTFRTPLRPTAALFSPDDTNRLLEHPLPLVGGVANLLVPDRIIVLRLSPAPAVPPLPADRQPGNTPQTAPSLRQLQ